MAYVVSKDSNKREGISSVVIVDNVHDVKKKKEKKKKKDKRTHA